MRAESAGDGAITIALYSHDSLGLGHARRNRALAFALAEGLPELTGERVGGVLIAGHPDAAVDALPAGWDWLVLPGVVPSRGGYAARRLPLSVDRLCTARGAAIAGVLDALDPALFIADRHPFGVAGELRPALRGLRDRGRATVLGLREVLDAPVVACTEWERAGGAAAVADAYRSVWIYGDPSVYDPRLTGEVPRELARIATATGYLSRDRPREAGGGIPTMPPRRYVLTVLGGGSDGADLARLAAAARPPVGMTQLIVTGPQMPDVDVAALRASARDDTRIVSRADAIPELIADAAAVVCMGGYNTLTEVMATTTPALAVPRTGHRAEQSRRVDALVVAGVVDTASALDAETLTAWLSHASVRRVDRSNIDLDGLRRVPRLAAELIQRTRRERTRAGRLDARDAAGAERAHAE